MADKQNVKYAASKAEASNKGKFQWATVQAQKNDIRANWKVARVPAVVFAAVVFVALVIPFAGMLWAPTTSTTENRELADVPQLLNEDGGFNVNVLADAGAYFEDHFAYRTNLVDADANVYSSLFGESVTDQVIQGKEGWLYYAGTINDFQNRAPYTDRQANNIAHNLALLQAYCQENGSQFVFTAAPNKSTVYPEYMSDSYPQRENSNMDSLKGYLEQYGVNYLDCFELMDSLKEEADKPLYFLRDSHWNDKTAYAVVQALEGTAGNDVSFTEQEDYIGDLNKMLFPLSAKEETNYYAEGINDGSGASESFRSGSLWSYLEGASTEDSSISTTSSGQAGSLVMYRDSFANNLVPFMASDYNTASFSKLIPYNALTVAEEQPSVVVVERAERHIDYLAQKAFIMPAPEVNLSAGEASTASNTAMANKDASAGDDAAGDDITSDTVAASAAAERNTNTAPEGSATCTQSKNGPLLSFEGEIAELGNNDIAADSTIYVRITGASGEAKTYEAFNLSNDETDWGYAAYVYASEWAGQEVSVQILVSSEGSIRNVGEFSFDIE